MTKVRHQVLMALAKSVLCARYRQLGYIGGMHPLERWTKEEIVNSIIEAEKEFAVRGCEQCKQPGKSCGHGFVADDDVPCVAGCGEPTMIRSRCGAARTAICRGAAPVTEEPAKPATAPSAARTGRARATVQSRSAARTTQQQDETESALRRLVTGERLGLLDALEGPFAPLKTIPGQSRRSLPYWRPTLPPIVWQTRVIASYKWQRPYTGRVVVLDRTAAWLAAASSALIAHGALEHTGAIQFSNRPGYYLVNVHAWSESDHLPHPLGNHARGDEVWIMAPTMQLLTNLTAAGRWPEATVLDSYTGDGVRINDWTTHVSTIRAHVISTWGRQSPQYDEVKKSIGETMSLLLGRTEPGSPFRTWSCKAARPDLTHTWQAQASATLWGWADDCRQVAPELPPVAVANTDELVLPEAALPIVTTVRRSRGRKPMEIDPAGIKLGSFKVKSIEDWTA